MWDIKYRPMRFTDVLGQEGTVKVLKGRLAKGTALDTSYIFSGGHGQGKTTLARILGRAMLCQNLTAEQEPCNECENCKDALSESSAALFEADAASKGTIDHVRTIVEDLAFVVPGVLKKVYIFDEVHRMSRDAQDVLLKPLEDKKLVGVFCTTEPEKIRKPIRSRCETYPIRKITKEDILARMKLVLQQEGVEYEDDAVLTVIDHSGGHVRDILNKLEMIAQVGPVTLESARNHLNLSLVSAYYRILISLGDPAKAVQLAEEACELVGPEDVAEGLAEAAMNAYRVNHGMFADFSLVDRDLCKQVYDLYGENTLRFSEYFLRSYKVSRIGLFTDILACRSGAPVKNETSAPPVLIQMATPPVAAVAAPPPPQLETTVVPSSEPPPAEPVQAMTAPKEPPTAANGRHVGNRGSSDPRALTDLDDKVVPLSAPRGRDQPKLTVPHGSKDLFLVPEEWTKAFEIRCSVLNIRGEP